MSQKIVLRIEEERALNFLGYGYPIIKFRNGKCSQRHPNGDPDLQFPVKSAVVKRLHELELVNKTASNDRFHAYYLSDKGLKLFEEGEKARKNVVAVVVEYPLDEEGNPDDYEAAP